MKTKTKLLGFLVGLLAIGLSATAQPNERLIKVHVAPQHSNWVYNPALSDLTGYLHGRAGGWPHMFNDSTHNTPAKIETSKYYDVVNFARHLTVPGFYSWGFNDVVCPPTSMYAAYNVITAPRTLFLAEETGHWTYPEQWEKA